MSSKHRRQFTSEQKAEAVRTPSHFANGLSLNRVKPSAKLLEKWG